jgi:glycosyltransferase involved in cell wall biosynthesis
MSGLRQPAGRGSRSTPRVSVCVPNLNTRPFLPERFRTILDQSFQDWELLVYDSCSNDGAWEYIRDMEAREPRMHAWQGPREGTPGSWTPCVRQARGEFVYIATSDDTMPPDCLETLVAALDEHPDCDLAHCPLRPIDENGRTVSALEEWWSQGSAFSQSSGSLVSRVHVRLAPFDGLLHLLGGSVYVSITQLMIRRSLFDRIGFFQSKWGSIGDFNWSMRAGLVANTVHVPDTWGGWRVHSSQATAAIEMESPAHARKIDAMIDDAVDGCWMWLAPALRRQLTAQYLAKARDLRAFTVETARRRHLPVARRAGRLAGQLCLGSSAAREYVLSRLLRREPAHRVRRLLEKAGYGPRLASLADHPGQPGPHYRHRPVSQNLDKI